MYHDRLIDRALKVALTSTHRWALGAVIAKGSNVLGYAPNKYRNPPRVDHCNASTHAEMAALRGVKYPAGSTIYVARVNKAGQARMARPCERCWEGLVQAGIAVVVFTTDEGYRIEGLTAPQKPGRMYIPQQRS